MLMDLSDLNKIVPFKGTTHLNLQAIKNEARSLVEWGIAKGLIRRPPPQLIPIDRDFESLARQLDEEAAAE